MTAYQWLLNDTLYFECYEISAEKKNSKKNFLNMGSSLMEQFSKNALIVLLVKN